MKVVSTTIQSLGKIFARCWKALEQYLNSPKTISLQAYLQQYFSDNSITDDVEKTFLVETLNGCVRYLKLLKIPVNTFLNTDGSLFKFSESHKLLVFSYLLFFRLGEITIEGICSLITDQKDQKLYYAYIDFVSNERNITTWIKDEWCSLYDEKFVSDSIINPFFRIVYDLLGSIKPLETEFASSTSQTAENKSETSSSPRERQQATIPQPFYLTQPKPKQLPMPEVIPSVTNFARPVPASLYNPPAEQSELASLRRQHLNESRRRLAKANQLRMSCATGEKSDKYVETVRRIAEETEKALTAKPTLSKKLGSKTKPSSAESAVVRLNAAAVLREGQLFANRDKETLDQLRELEFGKFSKRDYQRWYEQWKQEEQEAGIVQTEVNRLKGQLSYENAIIARQRQMDENREAAASLRDQARELMTVYMRNRAMEDEQQKSRRDKCSQIADNAREAKKRLQSFKQRIVRQMAEENRRLMQQALNEAEDEMRRKMALIDEIRAAESVAVERPKQKLFDATTTPGYGVLCEMSIAELKERLGWLQVEAQKERDRRRDHIVQLKQQQADKLSAAVELIHRHRREKTVAAAKRWLLRRQSPSPANPHVPITDAALSRRHAVDELHTQLLARREERLAATRPSVRGVAGSGELGERLKAERGHEVQRHLQMEVGLENRDRKRIEPAAQPAPFSSPFAKQLIHG